LSISEELESELLIQLSAVLELKSVVVECSIVACGTDVGGLSELVAGEEVREQETTELEAALVRTEHVLVVHEVGTEEYQESLKVHDLRVLSGVDES
jgi:hypothetical protein